MKYTTISQGFVMVVIVWLLNIQLPLSSVLITTKVVSSNLTHGEVYSIQHFVIKFVSDLLKVSGFSWYSGPGCSNTLYPVDSYSVDNIFCSKAWTVIGWLSIFCPVNKIVSGGQLSGFIALPVNQLPWRQKGLLILSKQKRYY